MCWSIEDGYASSLHCQPAIECERLVDKDGALFQTDALPR